MDRNLSRSLLVAAGLSAALAVPTAFAAAPSDNPSYPPPTASTASGAEGTDMGAPTGSQNSASMGQTGVQSDTDLTTQVKAKLASMSNLQGSNIVVSAKEGKVTLSGTASSKDAEKAAKSAAQSVPGVRKVDDDLKVSSKPPHPGA